MRKACMLWMLILGIFSACLCAAKDKKQPKNPNDPYATAELETAPAVNPADLAYRAVLFEDFTIPQEWEAKARKLTVATQEQAIKRLESTKAFTTVAKKQDQKLDAPYLVVKGSLKDYKMVSKKGRFFAGAMAGSSYIIYTVQILDGKSGDVQFQREISTENNAFAAAWSFNDKNLPTFLGNVLGDYLALRARTDKGANLLPIEAEKK